MVLAILGFIGLTIAQRSERELEVMMADSSTDTNAGLAAEANMIDIDNVSVTYTAAPERPVLENVNFAPQPGITLLCGASGSGKSSVLRLIFASGEGCPGSDAGTLPTPWLSRRYVSGNSRGLRVHR